MSSEQSGLKALAARHVPALRRNLRHVVDFWYPQTIDRTHGGFRLNHGQRGRWRGPAPKSTVSQARMLWLSARLARFGHAPAAMLEAAEHGHRFLMQRLWDERSGGFVWDVDAAGHPARRNRHLYAQAFGLYALSEYARASGRSDVLQDAHALFGLLEEKAKDREHPGYIEAFAPNWGPLPASEHSYLVAPPGAKLLNTHLHLVEALTTYAAVSGSAPARERLRELITVIVDRVIDSTTGAATDVFARDWTRLGGDAAIVSYGHDLEAIWLLAEACITAGMSTDPLIGRFSGLFEHALAYGYDAERGGFYESGLPGRKATRLAKIWWVQAESLVAALWMYRLSGDDRALDVFSRTWEWIDTQQTDWRGGEWHARIPPGSRPRGSKADVWKEGYHNCRALMECLTMLEPLSPSVTISQEHERTVPHVMSRALERLGLRSPRR